MGVQIAGGSYAELRDQGVSPQRALISGLANATMQAPLEKIGLDRFMGIFKSANFRDTVVRTLGAMGSEFVTEYVQKYPELATNLWALAEKQGTDPADQIAWFGRTLFDADTLAQANREGLYEGLIGAMWGGLGGGVRSLAIRNIERQKALDFAQRSVELHDAVEGSQTKQVAPDYMEDALDNASDVLAQSVFIPAQAALDLAAQGQDVLTPLGITMEQAQGAAEMGVDLGIKLSTLQTRLDSAGMSAVSQIMRQDADAPNMAEVSQVDAAIQAQSVIEETRQDQRKAMSVRIEQRRLEDEMSPIVGGEAAKQYAQLHASQAMAFQDAYGVDAAEIMQRRSVQLDTGASVFEQNGYHGSAAEFDKFDLAHIGEGNGMQAHGWGMYFALNPETAAWYAKNGSKDGKGHLYEADIPEDKVMLREDASFSEQPEVVQNALLQIANSLTPEQSADLVEQVNAYRKSRRKPADVKTTEDAFRKANGFDLYHYVAAIFGSRRAASEALKNAGVHGIRYRTESDGESAVVFDDAAINGTTRLYQDTEAQTRAQVSLGDDVAAIRIFSRKDGAKADLSSIPHESAHIFVDDLLRISQDDGSIARERLRSDIEQSGMDSAPFAGILSGEIDANAARSMLRDIREELESLDAGDEGIRAALAETGRKKEDAGARTDLNNARQNNAARRRELLPMEKMLASYVRHLDGLEQARADIKTLRKFAGISEEGDITAEEWTQVQEFAARGFEQYLSEGKAPSAELEGVFSRMLRWLKNIYASWRDYVGAELSDDVRMVFDRLLATDEQIKNSPTVQAALAQEQDWLVSADIDDAERAELENLYGKAEAEVQAKMASSAARDRAKRYRAAFEAAKEQLKNTPFWYFIGEIMRDQSVKTGVRESGINKESLIEYLGEDGARDLAKKMPRLVNAQGGGWTVDTLDVFAEECGLTGITADDLANLIYDTLVVKDASVNKLAARQAQQEIESQDNMVNPEDGLLDGDSYGKYLEEVEKAVRRIGKTDAEKGDIAAARRMERESLPESYYRNMAKREVAGMTVQQLSPSRFIAALRRAMNDRSKAAKRGRDVEAVRAVQRARMAFAMLQEVNKAKKTIEAAQNKLRRANMVKPGTYAAAQTEALRKLAMGLGVRAPATAWDVDSAELSLRELVEKSVGDTSAIDPMFPDWLLDLANPDETERKRGIALRWDKLQIEEVEQVGNLVDFLRHSGREQNATNKESLNAKINSIANSAAESMSSMPTYYASRRDSVGDRLDKGFSSIDSLEWEMRKADGFQNVPGRKGSSAGAAERGVYEPLREATDRFQSRLNSTNKAITPHLVQLLSSMKEWGKKYGKSVLNVRDEKGELVPIPEAMRRSGEKGWTAEMVIGMALNMGNDGNRERLRSSYFDEDGRGGLTYDMVSLLLGDDAAVTLFDINPTEAQQLVSGRAKRDGILSAADWRAIQGVWDVLGSQWEDTQKAHKKIYGFAPKGIEPGAFAVTVGGEEIGLRGGYYPIKYDSRLDVKMRALEGKEDILDRSEGLFGVPAARKGFTMGRVKHTGRSVRLGVDALQKHLVDSARFIELGYDVRFADKVINSPVFASEYQRVFGIQDYDRIRPNLKALVVDDVTPNSGLYQIAEKARQLLVYYALSMNLNTALMQLTAVFPAIHDIGLASVARGVAQLTTRGTGLVREIFAASPYMERRYRNIDQDMARKAMRFDPERKMTIIKNGKVYTWEDVANLGMMPIAVADLVITSAVWSGAYHKRMKELRGKAGWTIDKNSEFHEQAVAYADKVIAQSNPDNDALSRSAFGRDKGIVRMFNMFSGATTKFAQRSRYALQGIKRGKVSKFEFTKMEAYDMLLPALGMVVMKGLMQGAFGGDEEDDEQLKKLLISSIMGQAAMAVPVFGNAASDMIISASGAGGRGGELSTAFDTPMQLIGTALSRGSKAARGEDVDAEKLIMSAIDLGSYISRVPVGPVSRRVMRGVEQWQEGEGTPLSVVSPR